MQKSFFLLNSPCYRLIGLILFISLTGCSKQAPEHSRTILKFGTLIDVTLYDVDAELANDAFDQLELNFKNYHANWSPWEAGSELSQINQAIKNQQPIKISQSLMPLIENSLSLSRQSNEFFNPAIGELINLWQFHRHDDPGIKPPDDKQVKFLVKQNPRMSDLIMDNNQLTSKNRYVQLSFGAFAKGYAIDLSLRHLEKMGIKHAVINAGGDLGVIGSHGHRPWRIGIKHPRKPDTIAWLELKDHENIFTSGDYERYYIYNNKRYHHILDPETGYPTEKTASVTVIHSDAGLADAAATALFIAGPEQWPNIARSMKVDYVMLIDTDSRVYLSSKMAERIHLNQDIEDATVIDIDNL